jgi:hypothetical protein
VQINVILNSDDELNEMMTFDSIKIEVLDESSIKKMKNRKLMRLLVETKFFK